MTVPMPQPPQPPMMPGTPAPAPAMAPVAPAAAPAPYAAPAAIMPAMPGPVQGMPPAPAMPVVAGAMAAAPSASPMDAIRQSIATAKVSRQSNNIPDGTGIFVINNVVFEITTNGTHIDKVLVTCLVAMNDGNGLRHGEPNYSGAIPGRSYEYPIFRNYKYNSHHRNWLDLVSCFMGWTPEALEAYQATREGQDYLLQLIQLYIGYDLDKNVATQSCLANMNAAEINVVTNQKQKKDKATKQPMFDGQQQPIMTQFTNYYMNRHVLLSEIWEMYGATNAEFVYQCFGGSENFSRAWAVQNPAT